MTRQPTKGRGGPVTITSERWATYTRYELSCACGWTATEERKRGDTLDWCGLTLRGHLASCP